MSTANLVPETWGLTDDDAKATLARVGRRRLIADAYGRMRYSDGFSHARSMAFLGILLFVEGVIGVVGISRGIGNARLSRAISEALQSVVPGPAGSVLKEATKQADRAASSGYWLAIAFGVIGAAITGTTMMGQIQRALNRQYGIESDRPTVRKYAHAVMMALTAGALSVLALGSMGLGGVLAATIGGSGVHTAWNVIRWPVGILLLIAAIALILRWGPRRRQPAWAWMSFGAIVAVTLMVLATVALNLFFRFSSTFGSTYGPLAGFVALAFWTYASAIALLLGTALAAQLEAVRAGVAEPRSSAKVAASEPRPSVVESERPPTKPDV